MTEVVFIVPGRLDQLTGGYLYDRRVIDGLRARGHAVRVVELAPNARGTPVAELANGTTTVVDGLALSDFEQAVMAHWRRLRLVALVHHSLAGGDRAFLCRFGPPHRARDCCVATLPRRPLPQPANGRRSQSVRRRA